MRDSVVRIATGVRYSADDERARACGATQGTVAEALESLLTASPRAGAGSAERSPFGEWPEASGSVLIKPNWVHHGDDDERRFRALITQTELLEGLLMLLAPCNPERVTIADAPLQGCNWERLMARAAIDALVARHTRRFRILEVVDLRLVVRGGVSLGARQHDSGRDARRSRVIDLGASSVLEEVSSPPDRFRVTMYDPRELSRTHHRGCHQYSIAEEVLHADLVINVPKLKTHCKAGITAALKNLVGVNGHKSFLPHHRVGGRESGGDCYAGKSVLKRCAERLLDEANEGKRRWRAATLSGVAGALARVAGYCGLDTQLEGAWKGNDTIWRTVIDLQRIVEYADRAGHMSDTRQRKVLNICDGVVAGEGQGPLLPDPVDLGVVTLSSSAKAADWVHAHLIGVDPEVIPLVREAFRRGEFLTGPRSPAEIEVEIDGRVADIKDVDGIAARAFVMPRGW